MIFCEPVEGTIQQVKLSSKTKWAIGDEGPNMVSWKLERQPNLIALGSMGVIRLFNME
jgi:hypothetical protein